jgi:fructose-1,6-bisphosphatase/sedoheptulose 1,7-bisphosphatase-like protein
MEKLIAGPTRRASALDAPVVENLCALARAFTATSWDLTVIVLNARHLG